MPVEFGNRGQNGVMPEAVLRPRRLDVLLGVPHALPYQGSKRALAHAIVPLLPTDIDTLIEPFCGSAAVAVGALYAGATPRVVLRDVNQPLVALWQQILDDPDQLATEYQQLWAGGIVDPAVQYAAVRERFNADHRPADLLYLLARCVKAAVRYNAKGEFNQGPDNRRLGADPTRMRLRLLRTSAVLAGRTVVTAGDYTGSLRQAGPLDVVYLDPPYQGTSGSGDGRASKNGRYLAGLERVDFSAELERAVEAGTSFIVSYDGSTGCRTYGDDLPAELGLMHLHLIAGLSSQATLSGAAQETIESLYLSPALVDRLGGRPAILGV
jgi:DNA adenine methylase